MLFSVIIIEALSNYSRSFLERLLLLVILSLLYLVGVVDLGDAVAVARGIFPEPIWDLESAQVGRRISDIRTHYLFGLRSAPLRLVLIFLRNPANIVNEQALRKRVLS